MSKLKSRSWPETVTIGNRRWRLVCGGLPPQTDGCCDSPGKTNKKITISRRIRGENLLRVVIHELLHAADWDRSEDSVDMISSDIARILYNLGIQWSFEKDD